VNWNVATATGGKKTRLTKDGERGRASAVLRRDYYALLHAIAGVAWAMVAVGLAAGVVAGPNAHLLEVHLATDPEEVRRLVQ
jgi:hypothetical protein